MAPSADVSLYQPTQIATADVLASKTTTATIQINELPPPRPATLVLHPSFVTQDIDLLRFEAAASHQLPSPDSAPTTPGSATSDPGTTTSPTPSPAYSTSLISSPYNTPGHYLSLSTLSAPALLFALALTALKPTRPDYATAPYTSALNFPTILSLLRSLISSTGLPFPKSSFYVVIFRSTLRADADQDLLYKLDFESHREACESGGLLKYWFGKADLGPAGERRNLATCFWAGREEARRGGAGPWHARARVEGRGLYEQIEFERVRFVVEEGARGWAVEPWEGE